MKKLVFCTSCTDCQKTRAQGWINYYSEYLKDIDLLVVNDGICDKSLDRKHTKIIDFPTKLGRKTAWIFPGWKRSFCTALKYALENKYDYICHIESDFHLLNKEKFLYYFEKQDYYTSWCPSYNFPEASFQIINTQGVLRYYLNRYDKDNWYENVFFEGKIMTSLEPKYILKGDRYEGFKERIKPDFDFIAGDAEFFQGIG